jgi:hypothetical protein
MDVTITVRGGFMANMNSRYITLQVKLQVYVVIRVCVVYLLHFIPTFYLKNTEKNMFD